MNGRGNMGMTVLVYTKPPFTNPAIITTYTPLNTVPINSTLYYNGGNETHTVLRVYSQTVDVLCHLLLWLPCVWRNRCEPICVLPSDPELLPSGIWFSGYLGQCVFGGVYHLLPLRWLSCQSVGRKVDNDPRFCDPDPHLWRRCRVCETLVCFLFPYCIWNRKRVSGCWYEYMGNCSVSVAQGSDDEHAALFLRSWSDNWAGPDGLH